jgi:hypothetical protein
MKKIMLLWLLVLSGLVYGQNTMALPINSTPPTANLEVITWMEGHWIGEAFGGTTEEIWSAPAAGSMMFVFRIYTEEGVMFYESGHIREVEGSLVFQLKHFNADMTGWETKDEMVSAPLVQVEENRVYFDGFTFEKLSDDEINIYVVIGNEDGTTEEVKFYYKKYNGSK